MFYIIKVGHIGPRLFFTTLPYVLLMKLSHPSRDILNKNNVKMCYANYDIPPKLFLPN